MKRNGQKVYVPNDRVIVIPRQHDQFVFKASAVLDESSFEKLCPRPLPPKILLPGGIVKQDVESPAFQKALNVWSEQKFHWTVIESLKATDWLEWDTIDYAKSETWSNYNKELQDSGFSSAEIMRIIQTVFDANSLTPTLIDEATQSFLAGLDPVLTVQSSQNSEQNAMPSGEPANDSESNPKV